MPAIHVNDDYMRTYRPLMEPYYYDSRKYDSYLDQLGIKYPESSDQRHSPPGGQGGHQIRQLIFVKACSGRSRLTHA